MFPRRWPLVIKAEVKPASLLSTQVFICEQNTGDESAGIALDSAWSEAIQHLLSQRSSHNPGALDVPEVNREVQTGHIFRCINKAAAEGTGIFRLEFGIAAYKSVRFRFEQSTFERVVSNLQR